MTRDGLVVRCVANKRSLRHDRLHTWLLLTALHWQMKQWQQVWATRGLSLSSKSNVEDCWKN